MSIKPTESEFKAFTDAGAKAWADVPSGSKWVEEYRGGLIVSGEGTGQTMNKEQLLDMLQLLSALESWGIADKHELPDYLIDQIEACALILRREILK